MQINHNVVGWFDIPVEDMDRAVKFYQTVLGFDLKSEEIGGVQMVLFPGVENTIGSGGCLVKRPNDLPSGEGVLVYFTAFSGDLQNELQKVEAAGGKVVLPKTLISKDIGYMGIFMDSEGNRVALHSRE